MNISHDTVPLTYFQEETSHTQTVYEYFPWHCPFNIFSRRDLTYTNSLWIFPDKNLKWIPEACTSTLLQKFWRISLNVTNDAIAKLSGDVKQSQ